MSNNLQKLFEHEKNRKELEPMRKLHCTSKQNAYYGFNADLDLVKLCPEESRKWQECKDIIRVCLWHNGGEGERFKMSLAEAISFMDWMISLTKETEEQSA